MRKRLVVTAMPLKKSARRRLADQLDAVVTDIRAPGDMADLVLTPACSPQLIACLKQRYGDAQVVVVEISDWDYGVALDGPVKRILGGGADAYLLAESIDELAFKLDSQELVGRASWSVGGSNVDEIIDALLQQSIEHAERRAVDPVQDPWAQ